MGPYNDPVRREKNIVCTPSGNQSIDICNFLTEIRENTFKIVSLNVVSLQKHFKYVKSDQDMKGTEVIMLQ